MQINEGMPSLRPCKNQVYACHLLNLKTFLVTILVKLVQCRNTLGASECSVFSSVECLASILDYDEKKTTFGNPGWLPNGRAIHPTLGQAQKKPALKATTMLF